MAILLAALSAAVFGASDFLGGIASKRLAVLQVVAVSQVFSLILAVLAAPFFESSGLAAEHLAWGAGGGLAGAMGLGLLYRGLAQGQMAVVAPLTAITGSIVPIIVGLTLGERPSMIAWLGVAIAIPSVALITRSPAGEPHRPTSGLDIVLGLAAGVFFGLFGVFLAQTPEASGVWPLIAAKVASVSVVTGLVVTVRQSIQVRGNVALLGTLGFGDMAANILILAALRRGLLSLVPVVGALYPVSTILLARIVLNERIHRIQGVGLVAAAVSVVTIAAG